MSLAACPACNHNVSTAAPSCVNCGHPFAAIKEVEDTVAQAKAEIRTSLFLCIGAAIFWSIPGVLDAITSFSLTTLFTAALVSAAAGCFAFGVYWGLKGVRTLIPRGIILFLPIAGWMAYWVLKLFAAMAYGLLGGGVYEFIKRKRLVASHATA